MLGRGCAGKALRSAALLLAMASTAGARVPEELAQAVTARGLDPDQLVAPTRVTDEMRRWVQSQVPAEGGDERRLRALLAALVDPEGLGIVYEEHAHGTAEEVFASRRANCLAFTNLFVALARAAGLDAYYLEVRRRPRFQQEGDLVVVWEHVTAGAGPPGDRLVLEFSLGPPIESSKSRRLSDVEALAMYYANRGAEALLAGDPEGAITWLEVAVRLAPQWPTGWINLGVAQRRRGNSEQAEAAYRSAIRADPQSFQAFYNLAALLRSRGEREGSRELFALLDRADNTDPFIYLALGDASFEDGHPAEARRFYRRAWTLGPDQPETAAALGILAFEAGKTRRARRWLRRARARGGSGERLQRLARLLGDPREGAG